LLAERDRLQLELDAWHKANPGAISDMPAYRALLKRIGYLVDAPGEVQCETANVDAEVATLAGPQLVVPIVNARYALNAANARWGSLYDALYGTDVISEAGGAEKGTRYNPVRGQKVIEYARGVLDQAARLATGSHRDATAYRIEGGRLAVALNDGTVTELADPAVFAGFQGEATAPSSVLLRHHGLHLDIRIDRSTPIGGSDAAGVADVVVEAAVSTILDLEDSVAVVDADDKVLAYRNWLGILRGTLTEEVAKGSKTFTRRCRRGRPAAGPARPFAALRSQRRPPDDEPGDPAGRRQRDPGRHLGRRAHDHDRPARPEAPGHARPAQHARRQRLHRQAEDARAGRGGVRGRALRPRGDPAGPGGEHRQARHHGRGAAHQRQPEGLHRGRPAPRGLHQHRLPRPHR